MEIDEHISAALFNRVESPDFFDMPPDYVNATVWLRIIRYKESDLSIYVFNLDSTITLIAVLPNKRFHPSQRKKVLKYINDVNKTAETKIVLLRHNRECARLCGVVWCQFVTIINFEILKTAINLLASSHHKLMTVLVKAKVFDAQESVSRFNIEDYDVGLVQVINALGLSKYSRSTTKRSIEYYMTINDSGVTSEDAWRKMQLIIKLTKKSVTITTPFAVNASKVMFREEVLYTVKRFLNKTNLAIQFGAFYFYEKIFVILQTQAITSYVDSIDTLKNIVRPTIMIHLNTYKKYAFGLARLIEIDPMDSAIADAMLVQCEERYRKVHKIKKEEKKKLKFELPPKLETLKPIDEDELLMAYAESRADDEVSIVKFYDSMEDRADDEIYLCSEALIPRLCLILELSESYIKYSLENKKSFFMEIVTKPDNFHVLSEAFIGFAYDLLGIGIMFRDNTQLAEVIYFDTQNNIFLNPFLISKTLEPIGERDSQQYTKNLRKILNVLLIKVMKHQSIELKHQTDLTLSHKIDRTSFDQPILNTISTLLGRGGFGQVYRNELYGVKVALKSVRTDKNRENQEDSLMSEYRMLTNLNHENLIKVYGVTEYMSKAYIVMEYCSLDSLSNFIKTYEVDLWIILKILCKVARAVAFIHSKDVVHLDIKPHNVLLTEDLVPKLSDFGMCTKMSQLGNKKTGFTTHYASPEQLMGKNIELGSDVWSLGMTIYQVVTQNSPFSDREQEKLGSRTSAKDMLEYIVNENKRPTITNEFERENVELCALMRQCWELNPKSRPTAKAIADQLKELVQQYKSRRRAN